MTNPITLDLPLYVGDEPPTDLVVLLRFLSYRQTTVEMLARNGLGGETDDLRRVGGYRVTIERTG